MEIDFNCTKCGACCKLIPDDALKFFNLPIASGGGCGNLLSDNTCKIYNDRPDVCNTKTMWNKYYQHQVSWEEYCKMSEEICKTLINIMENKNVDKLD